MLVVCIIIRSDHYLKEEEKLHEVTSLGPGSQSVYRGGGL